MSQKYQQPPRRVSTHSSSQKRKDIESFYPALSTPPPLPVDSKNMPLLSEAVGTSFSSNRVLAGYMAHEFLTNGTLLGQKLDLSRAEAIPSSKAPFDSKRGKQSQLGKEKGVEPNKKVKPNVSNNQSYAEVANLLKSNGTQITGIVNPAQLGRWIQM